MRNLVSLTCPSLQILSKTQTGVFQISGFLVNQSLIEEKCHNHEISNDIDMKLGPVVKPDKRNKATSKKFGDNMMSANCDVVIFLIYDQLGAIKKPGSGRIACKTYIFINSNLLSYKN